MYFLDLIGTFAFAITGAYKAKGRKLHLLGVIFLGLITAVGGGTFRDLIIGRTPLFYLKDQNYILIAAMGAVITYFAPVFFKRRYTLFRFIDSIGLATFVIIGTSIAYTHLFLGYAPSVISFVSTVFLGMLTGFGGGIIRDAIMGDMPLSLKKESNYATSAFWGAFSFYIFMFVNLTLAVSISMIVTLVFREVVSEYGIYRRVFKSKVKS